MMNSWKVVLATMVIFGAGVITGGVLVRQTTLRPKNTAVRQSINTGRPQVFSPGNLRLEFIRRAERELDLSAGQRIRIDELIQRSQERSRKVMEPIAPKLREEVQQTREEFRAILTPGQRAQFDRFWKQQQPRPPREGRPPGSRERPSAPGPARPPTPGS
jgi:hypothetical protein